MGHMGDEWIWKAIEAGEVQLLQRMEHKVSDFDFKASDKVYGTAFLCFVSNAFLSWGAFPKEDAACRDRVSLVCQYLLSRGAEPTTRAPQECTSFLSLSWPAPDVDSDDASDDGLPDKLSIKIGFAGISALELLMDARYACQKLVSRESRWSATIEWFDYFLQEFSAPAPRVVHQEPKLQIPSTVVDVWQEVLDDTETADICLVCLPKTSRVRAHTALLRAVSPVLRAMLASPLQEGVGREIQVQDSEATVRTFIQLACTGCIRDEEVTVPALLAVLDLAHRWQAMHVVALLSASLSARLEQDDASLPAVCEAAVLKGLGLLRSACCRRLRLEDEARRKSLLGGLPASVQRELGVLVEDSKRRRVLKPL